MKKLIAIIGLSLFVAGCSTNNLAKFAGIDFNFKNPVSNTTLAQAESTYGVVLAAAIAYRSACAQRSITNCAANVKKLQNADKNVQIALDKAYDFIKANPNIDPSSVIQGVQSAIGVFNAVAKNAGAI